jgi:hypothetical protein
VGFRLAFVVGLLISCSVLAAQTSTEPQTFLRRQLGFTTPEVNSLDAGQIVVKLPKTTETREVAAFAIMRLDIDEEFFIDRVRDIVRFKKSENVLQIGKFSNPPRLEDLAELTLDPVDVEALKRCVPNRCALKLSAQAIERFRKEVRWSASDHHQQATLLMKQVLLGQLNDYLKRGNVALGFYNDKPLSLNLAEEFRTLLQPAPYMYGYDPPFQRYLERFPGEAPPQAESFVYWSKEKFGLKPVLSLTHVTIYKRPTPAGAEYMIASKGIYATHYFETSLGLTAFIHGQTAGTPRSYLIYINRSRTDALRGFLGGLKRSLITGSLRDGTRKNMQMIKQKLEGEYQARAR